jgi:DNA-binding beta-propeller fold protein YncE
VDPTGKFAYATNGEDNTVSAYTINASTGALAPIAGSPFAAGAGPLSITTTTLP